MHVQQHDYVLDSLAPWQLELAPCQLKTIELNWYEGLLPKKIKLNKMEIQSSPVAG